MQTLRGAVGAILAGALAAGCGAPSLGGPIDLGTLPPQPAVVEVEPDLNAVAPAEVAITKAQRWKQPKTDAKPEKGNVYVAVLVSIKAIDDADYSPYYVKLRDADGFEYDWMVIPRKEPSLGSGELAPGDAVKGWVTFEIPASAAKGKLTVIYDSLFGEQIQLPVKLK